MGYSPWGHKESDITEQLNTAHGSGATPGERHCLLRNEGPELKERTFPFRPGGWRYSVQGRNSAYSWR